MASFTCPKTSAAALSLPKKQQQLHLIPRGSVSFQSKPALLAPSSLDGSASLRFQASCQNQVDSFKLLAQLNEVIIEKSSNSARVPETKIEESAKGKNTVVDPSSISAFMTQVADLVELVDSRDIMELQLKNLDYEILIRKKEALQPPPVAPAMIMTPPSPQAFVPPPAQAAASAGLLPPPPASAPAAPAPAKPKSSHPPLKCPMAGTFYRSAAPGAPPFVKVGDKVQKGQVVCIIEAMKLMNEIEADQSGTVVEILAEDGKPVSLDTPLFIIEP